uniref:Reverse transcriptase domain-containing protein n=1 Tax=Oryzias latipes TaxID=8090 RepID=A0A3B3HNI1_ORYLA
MTAKQKWEFFKFKVRSIAIERSKTLNKNKQAKENMIMEAIQSLLHKTFLSDDEKTNLTQLQNEIDKLYIEAAKGAFIRSRAKWLENGEKNTSYFFALEKRNYKRNTITKLKIDNNICTDPTEITNHVKRFYEELYISKFNEEYSQNFLGNLKEHIPSISDTFKSICDDPLTKDELLNALKKMNNGKSPGNDGLSKEFYCHFWDVINPHLMEMYKECIVQQEMTATMKQGLITLIPKPNKDPVMIENWRPITLLNVDYKILALVYAQRLKSNLHEIISETQSGFMKNRHISNNIRLILDLLDYSEHIDSEALILFLDFYKAFDTVEHPFLYNALKLFGFGENFISIAKMFYKDISSSILLYPNTSQRFSINRSVRQGCPISPFFFLIVAELLSLRIKNCPNLLGLSIFQKEIKITQLADDTALFLKDRNQVDLAISTINSFSNASGLHLNLGKCEILSIKNVKYEKIHSIPIKDVVTYLGISITKDIKSRQKQNFSLRIKKMQDVMNMWLQRDLSIFGRILLTKAEGISRVVYPALSLFVPDSTSKEINNLLVNFTWKNRRHYLQKEQLYAPSCKGGFELIKFSDLNYTFKINWIKKCLQHSNSIWYFIPFNIFNKIGGLQFLLKCNYNIKKIPVNLSNFYQQALLAWKLCYNHNFSPHKSIIWNNEDITIQNKSLFKQNWIDKKIIYVSDLFDENGTILDYGRFLNKMCFPVTSKEFNGVMKALPSGLIQLMTSHLKYQDASKIDSSLMINGIDILNKKCNNKYIRNTLSEKRHITPKGEIFWNNLLNDINWKKAWLLPDTFCINNKVKEIHKKILHNIYPTNMFISKFSNIENNCSFCIDFPESVLHLFYFCKHSLEFWNQLECFVNSKFNCNVALNLKQIVAYFNSDDKKVEKSINLLLLLSKFYIHKCRIKKTTPNFTIFKFEMLQFYEYIKKINTPKASNTEIICAFLFDR